VCSTLVLDTNACMSIYIDVKGTSLALRVETGSVFRP
jgi:hypothetical protein